jgi:serine/threonine protein kinase
VIASGRHPGRNPSNQAVVIATTQSTDRQTFLTNLRQSGLLSSVELSAVARRLPNTDRGPVIARSLVEIGALTRFQAERLLAGRTAGFLLGQYKILDLLGRGGMGRVFMAEHQTMRRIVALKVLASELLRTERAQELFLREVRVIAKLTHPNIVTAFDANEVGGRFFLVLEYIDGPNLEQLVRKQGPLAVGLACDYVRQVAGGLQCAHARGMVHRDLKPANLLLQRRGFSTDAPGLVKISDLGLARLHLLQADPVSEQAVGTILTHGNTVMGTPDFLSPEQARNLHNADIRSDVYSLGCTFYFLLTGQVPFPGGQPMEKLMRHNSEQAAPVNKFRASVPAPVLAILDKMMAKRPKERYQTPAELLAALEPFAVSGPISWAPAPSGPTPLPDHLPPGDREPGDLDGVAGLANKVPACTSPVPVSSPTRQTSRRLRTVRVDRGRAKKKQPRPRRAIYLGILTGLAAVGFGLALLLSNLL